jgi:hydrogenase maturation protein HypF
MVPMQSAGNRHVKINVRGVVQGVGFRPFVFNLATRLTLVGSVANTGKGVEIFISGPADAVERFLLKLETEPPVLAHISDLEIVPAQKQTTATDFTIVASEDKGRGSTLISPDIATCEDCLHDIFSPDNRRFHYPFTNCTNCGPRMTIIKRIPYDRPHTSMAVFPMCPACESEYTDPADRRFHAQPNACPQCGPKISWHDCGGKKLSQGNEQCLHLCARALKEGKIVAVKGLGGFHLAVNAYSDKAVHRLREKKHRYGKPLAVMAVDLAAAEKIGHIDARERQLLLSKERPIVLVRKKHDILSDELSPGIRELGIMLPYTPLHHLLFAMPGCPDVLVMTSGNLSDEPICTGNRDALDKLGPIADFFLLHNRDIVTRVDDSVVRVAAGKTRMIRRSRGYVPMPITVKKHNGTLLACGAELKNTFCLTRPGESFVSQHIGDLKGPENMVFFEESIHYMQDVLEITPERIACDLHPDYLSSHYAACRDLPCIEVQHHYAHTGAIMAEHDLSAGIAVIFDGAGLGSDGTVWGGEFFYANGANFQRVAHLKPFSLPGGDRATREIWRLGLALLTGCGWNIEDTAALPEPLQNISRQARIALWSMIKKKINSPQSSSVGRLFDGVASLLGIRGEVSFEGQAAMELEALAWKAYEEGASAADADNRYNALITTRKGMIQIDFRPFVQRLHRDLHNGVPVPMLALAFHQWLIRSTAEAVQLLARRHKTTVVLLGGGCFQNRMLLEFLADRLEEKGLNVYSGEQIPVNDGGLALGQAYIAGEKPRE